MKHRHVLNKLNDYVDGLLDEEMKAAVEKHLAACHSCREEFEHLRSVHDWSDVVAGEHLIVRDGRDDNGDIVSEGLCIVCVRAGSPDPQIFSHAYATNRIVVARGTPL